MRDALGFVVTLAGAIADAAIDAMIREPDQAEAHGRTAFDAIWRMLAELHARASPSVTS